MKNLHLLPTDKPSRLFKVSDELKLTRKFDFYNGVIYQNLYITSDEEIKFDDYITDGYKVWQWKDDSSLLGRKKIILTTDPKLIADGIQAIDDTFLEWFVNHSSCEEVEVVKGFADGTAYGYNFLDYKIIILVEKHKPVQVLRGQGATFISGLEEPKFYVGQKVIVCNNLKTIITKIEDEKYYFLDEDANVKWDIESSLEPIIEPKQETTIEEAGMNWANEGSWCCPISFEAGAKWQIGKQEIECDNIEFTPLIEEAKKLWEESHPNPIEMALFGANWQAEQLFKDDAIKTLNKGLSLLLIKQAKMYSKEEVNEIIAEAWNSCEDNEGETFIEARKRILEQFKK